MCPIPQKIYRITKGLRTPDEVEQNFPGFLAFIDCTEQQQIQSRPIQKGRCKICYSGKKKRQTIKIQLMIVNNHRGLVIHKLGRKSGRRYIIYSHIQKELSYYSLKTNSKCI